jgi:hypothetical protein
MPPHTIHNAIVGIDTLMVALQSLPPLVPRNTQCDPVLRTQLLQLGHDAAGDDGPTLGVQARHHGLEHLELVLHCVGEEICVDEDGVGRFESCVVLEEEGGGDLGDLADHIVTFGGFRFGFVHDLVLLSIRWSVNLSNAGGPSTYNRLSRWVIIRFTWANFLDFFALVILNAASDGPVSGGIKISSMMSVPVAGDES